MKVLFAVNNDNISEAIVKKYQKEYKEIISSKNVYYFNAILKELQIDKTYDRVVISEDLEPFANNNYDTIDKFLFEKLDKISDEATKVNGEDIEIILICADRRNKADEMLIKIFGIGIYNALIGEERNVDNLCRLLNHPRTKKEAKIAYKIQGNNVIYQLEDENSVSESEVQNILAHYKRLGKNEDKYVDSFNNIVSQYTDAQLRIIIKYLPLHVKAVLEEKSSKYQELSTFSIKSTRPQEVYMPRNLKTLKQEEKINVQMLSDEKKKITKPIVIPSALDNKKIVKLQHKETEVHEKEHQVEESFVFEEEPETPKKGRGRPRKNPVIQEEKPKRGRGRPKKEEVKEENEENFDVDFLDINDEEISSADNKQENEQKIEDLDFDIFNLGEEDFVDENTKSETEEVDLFNMDFEQNENTNNEDDVDLFSMDELEEKLENDDIDLFNIDETEPKEESVNVADENNIFDLEKEENHFVEPTVRNTNNINSLLTNEKKIVSFVGTTKNGTSFVVNNLGLTLSGMNISTAILDMTQNKNSYYIFTNNDERLRRIAESCFSNLENGIAEGIKVDRNLTVYTEIPGQETKHDNIEKMLQTLMEKHDVVLIDADFNTEVDFFEQSHEIYLVQSMDVLTIQPLTAFLRNLKTKNVLRQEKIKIIINKEQKVRSLSDKLLIGGMSSYNNPSMTLMTEVFNKDNVKYCKIPFELQNYVKYLDSLVNCEISLRGYTKQLIAAFSELASMVYPLINKTKYSQKGNKKTRMDFSDETKNTLNKMRKNY